MEGREERDRTLALDTCVAFNVTSFNVRLTITITYHKNELELIVELVFKTQGLVGE